MSKHEGIRYECDLCEYSASKPHTLNNHKKTIHDGLKIPCDNCSYEASTTSTSTSVTNVSIKQFTIHFFTDTNDTITKESDIIVTDAISRAVKHSLRKNINDQSIELNSNKISSRLFCYD